MEQNKELNEQELAQAAGGKSQQHPSSALGDSDAAILKRKQNASAGDQDVSDAVKKSRESGLGTSGR